MKTLAYTIGEPAGIGADIIIQLAQQQILSDVVCIGNQGLLEARANLLGLPLKIVEEQQPCDQKSMLRVRQLNFENPAALGDADTANSPAVLKMLDMAIDGCLDGQYAGMVTGPLHKGIINDAGYTFSGHTEYLAERTKAELPVMLLATEQLRVALVTTHLPLKEVSAAITEQRIQQICRIVNEDFKKKYKIKEPRLLVCGLNPHAGEGGHLGMEEIEVIIPTLDKLRAEGLNITGPLPADTLFTPRYLDQADVAIAMYHDQGLPVLKALGFGQAANITLGLPIIRTSVDHGTAFDLAGSGKADIGSLKTALNVARMMVNS